VLLGGAIAWAFTKPKDPRGDGIALLAELQGYFLAASWAVVFVILYLLPRLW
jgi:hypothetical protein